jgi:hypothetical protein
MNQNAKAKQALAKVNVRPVSTEVARIRGNINMIQEAMQATMKQEVHYGVIPGCKKPSLYKAGAETLIALFQLTFRPEPLPVEQKDNEVRYLIRMDLLSRDGVFIGSGIGECSSGEEKYSWRAAVCDEEWETTPEDRRRIKFKKGWQGAAATKIQQVRVPASDMANTILKMAKKRALIDAVLTATAASDIFVQDVQDLPEGVLPDEVVSEPTKEQIVPPAEPEPPKTGPVISDAQRKRLYAIAMGAGMEKEGFKEWLLYTFDVSSSKDITKDQYEDICTAAEGWKK